MAFACLQQPELAEAALQSAQLLRALLSCMQRCKADLPVAAATQCLKVLLHLGGAPVVKSLVAAGEEHGGGAVLSHWCCFAAAE